MKKFLKLVAEKKKRWVELAKKLKEKKKDKTSSFHGGFDYDKYFDIPRGKDHPRFEDNEQKFNPNSGHYAVHKVENISEKKARIGFNFLGSKGKYDIENGERVHYQAWVRFVGSILCDEITSMEKDAVKKNESVIFTIDKEAESGQKIIYIQNPEVGEITIKCKKIYAEKLDCGF